MADEGVAVAFVSDEGAGAVTGEDFDVVGELHDAAEGFFELVDVAVGEVVAANGPGHEEVACEEDGVFVGVEHDMAGGVARGVHGGEGDVADVDFLAIFKIGVGSAREDGVGEVEEEADRVEEPGLVEGMDEDFGVGECVGDDFVIGDVVPVGVGEEEILDVVVVLLGECDEGGGGGFGCVDDGGGFGGFIDEEVGVGFGEAAGVHVDFHLGCSEKRNENTKS